jgi:hypothetical protein
MAVPSSVGRQGRQEDAMATFEVTLKDRTVEVVDGADAYQQEGPMTTFFATRPDRRGVVDSWSERVASIRTAEVIIIRRSAGVLAPAIGEAHLRTA